MKTPKLWIAFVVAFITTSCTQTLPEIHLSSTSSISTDIGIVTTSASTPTPANMPRVISSATMTTTPYSPVSVDMPFPLLYEQITPDNAANLSLIARWESDIPFDNLMFSPIYDVLCMGNEELVQGWDIFSGEVAPFSNECAYLTANSHLGKKIISPDNQFAAKIENNTQNGYIEIYNLSRPLTELRIYLNNIVSAGFSSNGEWLVIAFKDGMIWFVEKENWREILLSLSDGNSYYFSELTPDLVIKANRAPLLIQFSSNDSLLALLFDDETIQLWNVSSLTVYSTIQVHVPPNQQINGNTSSDPIDEIAEEEFQNQIYKIAISPNNLVFATASQDGFVRLWDARTGTLLTQFRAGALKNGLVFSLTGRVLASLHNENLVYVWGILPTDLEIAQSTSTAIANQVINSPPTKVSLPAPTATPTSALFANSSITPFAWAVLMPSDEQVAEIGNCNVEIRAKGHYPETMSYWELEHAYPLKSACDWAVLSYAYRLHFSDKESIPEEGKLAFLQSVRQNPAFAMNTTLFYTYFNSMHLVVSPSSFNQPITSVIIDYEWSGIGEPPTLQYHIEIDNASSNQSTVEIEAQPTIPTSKTAINSEQVQELGNALIDFLPVQSPFTLQTCYDNYPDWNVLLTFLDGTELKLKTYDSNLLTAGGPWFMELNGQHYSQFSSALVSAMLGLFESLELPLGQPYAMYCSQVDTFELAFP